MSDPTNIVQHGAWMQRYPANPNDAGWRAGWVRYIVEHLKTFRPVDPDTVRCASKENPDPSPLVRLSYARAESISNLRTTLHAAAWAGALDVCSRDAQALAEWHRRMWGIREPVSDDVSAREHQLQLVVKRVVRAATRVQRTGDETP
jgi:hypothetical protein